MSIGKIFNTQPIDKRDQTQDAGEASKKSSLRNKIKYHASLIFTLANRHFHHDTHQWWNRIKGTNITLGAIPLKNREHHIRIINDTMHLAKAQKKIAVLTLLESFEIYSTGPLSVPVTPEDWKKLGVIQKIIPASDFNPLSQKEIEAAVLFLEEQDKQGIPTYVHCKAGRGRSAAAVICFLMKKYQYTAEKAKEKVFESRSQINLNKYQWKAIKTYEVSLNLQKRT